MKIKLPYGRLVLLMILGLAAWTRAEGPAPHWCEERTAHEIRICLTREPSGGSKTFPLAKAYLHIPGADPVAIVFGPGEPGPGQKTGNRALDGGAGDAAWMESTGFGSDGRAYRLLVSWSYFILSENPDNRNVYVKSIRDLDAGKDFLEKGGTPWAIRMQAVKDIAAFHPEFAPANAGPAPREIHSHWDQGSLALSGRAGEAFFEALNAPVQFLPGGFRQPSAVKFTEFGPLRVLCDTFPRIVCTITWNPSSADSINAPAAGPERDPCLKDFSAAQDGFEVACGRRQLSLRRRAD